MRPETDELATNFTLPAIRSGLALPPVLAASCGSDKRAFTPFSRHSSDTVTWTPNCGGHANNHATKLCKSLFSPELRHTVVNRMLSIAAPHLGSPQAFAAP
ncbi:hypothetical protein CCGE525_06630 [Rhizobium jaguaris]|uniref:Uncharacterized protein n=1 Tax=Rhizobium jaguaris TaxID=1312183 RepID=A0A387FS11_9HYPH|nr:hypothetical protein CCGE525_06630 [Rhizobium jaguaris]